MHLSHHPQPTDGVLLSLTPGLNTPGEIAKCVLDRVDKGQTLQVTTASGNIITIAPRPWAGNVGSDKNSPGKYIFDDSDCALPRRAVGKEELVARLLTRTGEGAQVFRMLDTGENIFAGIQSPKSPQTTTQKPVSQVSAEVNDVLVPQNFEVVAEGVATKDFYEQYVNGNCAGKTAFLLGKNGSVVRVVPSFAKTSIQVAQPGSSHLAPLKINGQYIVKADVYMDNKKLDSTADQKSGHSLAALAYAVPDINSLTVLWPTTQVSPLPDDSRRVFIPDTAAKQFQEM